MWHVVLAVSLLKLLLVPFYKSIDFEVHRNWMAITYSLPLSEWYVNATSDWTLDYAPIFAWFEWLLSQFAAFVDPNMLDINNLHYKSQATLFFQMGSVIVTDFAMAFGIRICAQKWHGKTGKLCFKHLAAALIFTNAALIMLDHIHFHYTGILLGILLSSIGYMLKEDFLKSASLFVMVLNMNQTFLFFAPAYFIYLLTTYCHPGRLQYKQCKRNFVNLSLVVLSGFALSFGPFIYYGKLTNVLNRIFPIKRGLVHSYWAPNFWAFYSYLDTIIIMFGSNENQERKPGQVFMNLLDVPPHATMIITLAALIPILYQLWQSPKQPLQFVRALTLTAFTCFMFGW